MKTETVVKSLVISAAKMQRLHDSALAMYRHWLESYRQDLSFDCDYGDRSGELVTYDEKNKPLESWEEFFQQYSGKWKATHQSNYGKRWLFIGDDINDMLVDAVAAIEDTDGHKVNLFDADWSVITSDVYDEMKYVLFNEVKPFVERKMENFFFLLDDEEEEEILKLCPDFVFHQE